MRFAIASNGFAEGPAQALRDYLVARPQLRVEEVVDDSRRPLTVGEKRETADDH